MLFRHISVLMRSAPNWHCTRTFSILRCIDANAITKLSLPCAGGCFDTRALKMHNATPKVHLLTVTVVRRLVAALPNLEVASVPVEVGPSRFMSARHEDRLAYDLYALCSGTDRTKRQKRVDVRVDVRVRFASARLAALLCGDALPNSNPPLPPLTARTTTTTTSSSSSTLPHPTDPHNTSSRSPHTVAVFHTNAVRRFTCHLPSPSHLTALGRSVAACPSLDSLKVKPWGARVPGPRLSASAEQLGWSCAMSRMRVLDLTACGLGVKGFVALARGLAAGGAAAYLQAFLVGQREGPARASGRCGDAGAAALAEALLSPSWSMLEFFCVAHNGVTDAGAHAVARAVESRLARGETPALRQVSLKGNMLSKRALNRICAVNRVLSSRSGSADIDFDAVDLGGFLYEKKESAL
ncbi:F-box domain-containing protein [Pycnococcus provasolii]